MERAARLRQVTIVLWLSAQGCSGPPLELWHTEKLTEEFTAVKSREVRSFDDYRELEQRLFAQLEERGARTTVSDGDPAGH